MHNSRQNTRLYRSAYTSLLVITFILRRWYLYWVLRVGVVNDAFQVSQKKKWLSD